VVANKHPGVLFFKYFAQDYKIINKNKIMFIPQPHVFKQQQKIVVPITTAHDKVYVNTGHQYYVYGDS
jgi:hypothetical protein